MTSPYLGRPQCTGRWCSGAPSSRGTSPPRPGTQTRQGSGGRLESDNRNNFTEQTTFIIHRTLLARVILWVRSKIVFFHLMASLCTLTSGDQYLSWRNTTRQPIKGQFGVIIKKRRNKLDSTTVCFLSEFLFQSYTDRVPRINDWEFPLKLNRFKTQVRGRGEGGDRENAMLSSRKLTMDQ